jgi:hypothetical protein
MTQAGTPHANGFAAPAPVPKPVGYHGAVSEFKRRLIEATLCQLGGNRTRAAMALGLQRTYLLRLIREFGVDVPPPVWPPRGPRPDPPPPSPSALVDPGPIAPGRPGMPGRAGSGAPGSTPPGMPRPGDPRRADGNGSRPR